MSNKTFKSAFVISLFSISSFSATESYGAAAAEPPAAAITLEQQAVINHINYVVANWPLPILYHHFSTFYNCRRFVPTAISHASAPATFRIYFTHKNAAGSPAITPIYNVPPRPSAVFEEMPISTVNMQAYVDGVALAAVHFSNPCGVTGLLPGPTSVDTHVALGSLKSAEVLYLPNDDGSMNERICYRDTGAVTASATSPLSGAAAPLGTKIVSKMNPTACEKFAKLSRQGGTANITGSANPGLSVVSSVQAALADALAVPNPSQILLGELYATHNNNIATTLYSVSPAETLTAPHVGIVSPTILTAAHESLITNGVIPKTKFDAIVSALPAALTEPQALAAINVIAASSLDAPNSATVAAGVSITATPAAITTSTLQSVQLVEASAK